MKATKPWQCCQQLLFTWCTQTEIKISHWQKINWSSAYSSQSVKAATGVLPTVVHGQEGSMCIDTFWWLSRTYPRPYSLCCHWWGCIPQHTDTRRILPCLHTSGYRSEHQEHTHFDLRKEQSSTLVILTKQSCQYQLVKLSIQLCKAFCTILYARYSTKLGITLPIKMLSPTILLCKKRVKD